MKLGITVIGSGSKGNSIFIHNASSGILIDAGFSRKEILARLAKLNINPNMISAILITHDHGDHVRGARVLADQLDIPTFVNESTYKHLKFKNLIGKKVEIFDPGTAFNIEEFKIKPFSVPHDAMEPVGFAIFANRNGEDIKIGIATDLGHVNNLVQARLQECDILILECNHDKKMLRDSERKLGLKQRIAGRFGHLNNEASIEAIEKLLHKKTKHLILYHLSSDCNSPELVANLANAKLAEMNRNDINLQIAKQDQPLNTIWI